uniref:GDSL esterase/lipase 6-like n=1 Tax=Erigeron canadensis TaxID=72917 RepID=UPI001CB8F98B|nr:GDSL esterase/lipase 6-like [Erigeron canadensis]
MGRLPHLILFLGIYLAVLALVDANVKSVFVFGDSQFDPGNNKYIKDCGVQANFTPYGSSFFHTPTGRFTNGRTVVDFIAQYMGIKFQKPFQEVHQRLQKRSRKGILIPANGINFASAGSGLLPTTNDYEKVTTIQVQLQQFQGLIKHNHLHKKQIAKSIYLVASGSNDIFSYYFLPQTTNLTKQEYVHAMLQETSNFVDKIYKLGARRIAIFPIGPMGCIPGRVLINKAPINRCSGIVNNMCKYYNVGLKRLISSIPRKYPGAIGVCGEVYNNVQKLRANPKLYGFSNVSEACCGGGPLNGMLQCGSPNYKLCKNPNEYFYWDFFHPSERTYRLFAKMLWAGGKKEIWPINLKTLAHITLPFS